MPVWRAFAREFRCKNALVRVFLQGSPGKNGRFTKNREFHLFDFCEPRSEYGGKRDSGVSEPSVGHRVVYTYPCSTM